MLEEITDFVQAARKSAPGNPFWIMDGTFGDGGHSIHFSRLFPGVRVLAWDRDPEMMERGSHNAAEAGIKTRRSEKGDLPEDGEIGLFQGPFSGAARILRELGIHPAFILIDCGVSIHHFRTAARGFSFQDEKLDMRLSPDLPLTAEEIVNSWELEDLVRIFSEFGEEPRSKTIARKIIENRPIHSASALAGLIDQGHREKIHPATRVFQALRIAVNGELDELQNAMEDLPALLRPGGMLSVLTFHSLEDRIVKRAFQAIGERKKEPSARRLKYRTVTEPDYLILTRRPVEASAAEISRNPPSRSAKLRVLQKHTENNRDETAEGGS